MRHPCPILAGMDTTKRKWVPKQEWARRQVAECDAALRALAGPEPDWRRRRARDRGRAILLERRMRLARIANPEPLNDWP